MKHVVVKGTELASLIEELRAGEEIILEQDGRPVAQLSHVASGRGGVDFEAYDRWRKEKGLGRLVEKIPDDFDAPLPEDFLITPEQ